MCAGIGGFNAILECGIRRNGALSNVRHAIEIWCCKIKSIIILLMLWVDSKRQLQWTYSLSGAIHANGWSCYRPSNDSQHPQQSYHRGKPLAVVLASCDSPPAPSAVLHRHRCNAADSSPCDWRDSHSRPCSTSHTTQPWTCIGMSSVALPFGIPSDTDDPCTYRVKINPYCDQSDAQIPNCLCLSSHPSLVSWYRTLCSSPSPPHGSAGILPSADMPSGTYLSWPIWRNRLRCRYGSCRTRKMCSYRCSSTSRRFCTNVRWTHTLWPHIRRNIDSYDAPAGIPIDARS